MEMSLFSDEQIMKAYTKDIERQTAERVERETAQRVERETAQREAKEIACRLLKIEGISINTIAESTGLSVEEVKALAEEKKYSKG